MESYKLNRNTEENVEEVVNARQLGRILNTSTTEVAKWCQRACLKPRKDGFGNIYFSKSDIDVLRKVKELYEHTRTVQDEKKQQVEAVVQQLEREEKMITNEKTDNSPVLNISHGNFLTRAKSRFNKENAVAAVSNFNAPDVAGRLCELENNIVSKITDVLAEKMDGLDEVIVELIRAKTENENLRQRLNELNKENFNLKSENASYKSLGLGLYVKKNTDDFVL